LLLKEPLLMEAISKLRSELPQDVQNILITKEGDGHLSIQVPGGIQCF